MRVPQLKLLVNKFARFFFVLFIDCFGCTQSRNRDKRETANLVQYPPRMCIQKMFNRMFETKRGQSDHQFTSRVHGRLHTPGARAFPHSICDTYALQIDTFLHTDIVANIGLTQMETVRDIEERSCETYYSYGEHLRDDDNEEMCHLRMS